MNVGAALDGIFYAFVVAVVATIVFVLYVIWQTFFGLTPWDVCVKMETDTAKVQCMEAHHE